MCCRWWRAASNRTMGLIFIWSTSRTRTRSLWRTPPGWRQWRCSETRSRLMVTSDLSLTSHLNLTEKSICRQQNYLRLKTGYISEWLLPTVTWSFKLWRRALPSHLTCFISRTPPQQRWSWWHLTTWCRVSITPRQWSYLGYQNSDSISSSKLHHMSLLVALVSHSSNFHHWHLCALCCITVTQRI